MFSVKEVEYSALRSRPGFENERATIRVSTDEDPVKVLGKLKSMVDTFLGESLVAKNSVPPGNDPIMPDVDPAHPVIDF